MERCAVADVKDKLIGKLSKGYRQRVGLAQAIIHNPDVLILDEPTSGLDPKQINETRELIKSLAGEHTIILSTHILPEVEAVCEKVIIINKGRVVATDSVENLKNRARRGRRYSSASETRATAIQLAVRQRLEQVPGVSKVLDQVTSAVALCLRSGEPAGPQHPSGCCARDRPCRLEFDRTEILDFQLSKKSSSN